MCHINHLVRAVRRTAADYGGMDCVIFYGWRMPYTRYGMHRSAAAYPARILLANQEGQI